MLKPVDSKPVYIADRINTPTLGLVPRNPLNYDIVWGDIIHFGGLPENIVLYINGKACTFDSTECKPYYYYFGEKNIDFEDFTAGEAWAVLQNHYFKDVVSDNIGAPEGHIEELETEMSKETSFNNVKETYPYVELYSRINSQEMHGFVKTIDDDVALLLTYGPGCVIFDEDPEESVIFIENWGVKKLVSQDDEDADLSNMGPQERWATVSEFMPLAEQNIIQMSGYVNKVRERVRLPVLTDTERKRMKEEEEKKNHKPVFVEYP